MRSAAKFYERTRLYALQRGITREEAHRILSSRGGDKSARRHRRVPKSFLERKLRPKPRLWYDDL